jgi:hypothetical protein
VFLGAPTVPSLTFNTASTIQNCVTDGGFTNCVAGTQTVSLAAAQTGVCNLDGGNGNQCVLMGGPLNGQVDAGAQLPGLTSTTVVMAALLNPATPLCACNAITEAPGGDAGVVVIECGTVTTGVCATLGFDGGQVTYMRMN